HGWSPTGAMAEARNGHAAVLLPSGKVLVLGGQTNGPGQVVEIYDPATGGFQSTGQTLFDHGYSVTGTLLNDGQVLVVGGLNQPSAAELYDPVSGQFAATGTPIQPHGFGHTATLLADGRVLVVGGLSVPGSVSTTNINSGAEV